MRRTLLFLGLCGAAALAQSPAPRENTLPMGQFQPVTMLHVPEHPVALAKFLVIDVHNHVNDATEDNTDRQDPAKLVRLMDELNIRKIVILTGGWGEKLQKVIDQNLKPYPDRFVVMTQVDWKRIDEPDFGKRMAEQIRDAVRRGARGLKVLKELGLEVRDKSGGLVPVDDARLDPIWAECGRLGIPVAMHVADPEAFFRPIDNTNERYDELGRYPEWSFCCPPRFPTLQEILEQRDRMLAKHPETTFILLHFGHWPENLDHVERTLRRFPNTYIETGARQAELGRQPRRTRELILQFPDRVMFGTDIAVSAPMYRSYFRWLETADEYFDYFGFPGQGFWKISGMYLPDAVLEKMYHGNVEKVFAQFRGGK